MLALGAACAAAAAEPPAASDLADATRPLAVIDGKTLTLADVQGPVAFRIYRLQVDLYHLLKTETERRVDQILLAREAARRGTTTEALLASVEAEAAPVTDEEVQRYLAENPPSTPVPPEEAWARVHHFLGQSRRIEKRLALLEGLREAAGYRFVLPPPEAPRTEVDVSGAPVRGPDDAPVTIVHFAAFGSDSSARSAAQLARVRQEFPGRIRVLHRNLPRSRDERALLAARLGFRAQEVGRFWEVHDRWFALGGKLDETAVVTIAREAGLSADDVEAARSDAMLLQRVRQDVDAAEAAGAPREPTLFVNGRYLSGLQPYQELRDLVSEELGRRPEQNERSEIP